MVYTTLTITCLTSIVLISGLKELAHAQRERPPWETGPGFEPPWSRPDTGGTGPHAPIEHCIDRNIDYSMYGVWPPPEGFCESKPRPRKPPRTESRPRVCYEHRDYYHYIDSGGGMVWIGWKGEPYRRCQQGIYPRPIKPLQPGYDGGLGHEVPPTRFNQCVSCENKRLSCHQQVESGYNRCIDELEGKWRRRCMHSKRRRNGKHISTLGRYTCKNGLCEGRGIDRCVNEYMNPSPDINYEDERSMELSVGYFKVGGKGKVITQWGGHRGARQACEELSDQVANMCEGDYSQCEAPLGVCEREAQHGN